MSSEWCRSAGQGRWRRVGPRYAERGCPVFAKCAAGCVRPRCDGPSSPDDRGIVRAMAAPTTDPARRRPGPPGRPVDLTPADVRWLAWHEARCHALTGREVRDLGDAVLLYDETDREPFWNRLAGISWPSEAGAFDRRLAEAFALFAGLDRIPHVWPMPGFDEPVDLTERLLSVGFEDHGGGILMGLDPALRP